MTYSNGIGWAGVATSVVAWGFYMFPTTKNSKIKDKKVSPEILQLYMSLGVGLTSLLPLFYYGWKWSWWGTAQATLYVSSNILAVGTVKYIGVGPAQGLWGGSVVVLSFFWGLLGTSLWGDPKCELHDTGGAVGGIALLALAIAGLAMFGSQGTSSESIGSTHSRLVLPPERAGLVREFSGIADAQEWHSFVPDGRSPDRAGNGSGNGDASVVSYIPALSLSDEDSGDLLSHTPGLVDPLAGMSMGKRWAIGIMRAFVIGLLGGTMMVPIKMAEYKDNVSGMEFLPSFGFGVLLVTPILVGLFLLASGERPSLNARVALGPGLTTGFLWNIGNVGSVFASLSGLGQTAGYPLTQSCLLVAGLFGIAYYKEIRGSKLIGGFLASGAVVVVGAVLLGSFGACKNT